MAKRKRTKGQTKHIHNTKLSSNTNPAKNWGDLRVMVNVEEIKYIKRLCRIAVYCE